jgi:hypothetical protein
LDAGGTGVIDFTPYIHKIVYHVPHLLERWGSMCAFSCETLERYVLFIRNHCMRLSSFRLTEFFALVYDFAWFHCEELDWADFLAHNCHKHQ